MRPAFRLIKQLLTVALALLPLLPALALAQPTGYAAGFDSLYRINLATGQATEVGPMGFADVEGMAFAADNTLYAVADAGSTAPGGSVSDWLLRINTTTGQATAVGQLSGLAGMGPNGNLDYGLSFTCDGRLWLTSDTTSQLWEVNPANAATTLIGNMGAPISGLTSRGDTLYGLGVESNRALYRINTSTAAASLVGNLGVSTIVADAGLAFDSAGRLWATLDPEPLAIGNSVVVEIDPSTGVATVVGTVNVALGMEALAIAPPVCTTGPNGTDNENVQVPGPGLPLLALLSLLLLGLAVVQIRRLHG